jgi:hypothetical protein
MLKYTTFCVLFLFVFSTICNAQLDYGKVKGSTKLCNRLNKGKNYNPTHLCTSKNIFEVRLTMITTDSMWRVVTLSYDSNKTWKAKQNVTKLKITDFPEMVGSDNSQPMILEPTISYDSIFSCLKENGLFTLNSQSDLGLYISPVSVAHTIVYKAGNKYRRFYFYDVETSLSQYPNNKKIRQYSNILRLLTSDLNIR